MAASLQEVRDACLACRKCGLCETRQNVVFGVGAADAKILFVGEGPGEQEDKTGEPFVGRGGQLLDKYLAHIDLARGESIYIANIVKCRPPQNRDPREEEQAACAPWLREQIRLLQPRIIVCLGRIAAQFLIRPDFRVTREHGTFYQKNGVWLMGTYHPAALLRNPAQKGDALADFCALRDKIAELGLARADAGF